MKIKLEENVRLLIVQADLNSYDAIPFSLLNKGEETKQESKTRKIRGKMSAPDNIAAEIKDKKIFAAYLPISLLTNNFVLVNAEYRKRQDKKITNLLYHSVRYTLVRKKFENLDDAELKKFLPFRGIHSAGLQEICELALWEKLRVYRNPFYDKGIEIPGQSAVSINLNGRKPLYESKNASLDFTPDEIPDYWLVMIDNLLKLEPFQD